MQTAVAVTDQFAEGDLEGVARAREVLPRLRDEYKRAYYAGIICERRAMAQLHRGGPGAEDAAADWLRDALGWFERAEAQRPLGNDEAILRWNTCVRTLGRLGPAPAPAPREYEPVLDD